MYQKAKIVGQIAIQFILIAIIWNFMWFFNQLTTPALTSTSLINFMLFGAPYVFVAFLLLDKPVSLIRPVIRYLDSKHLFWQYSIYGLISTLIAGGALAFLLSYIPESFAAGNGNPLLAWYTFSGHWLTWILIVAVVVRYGWKDIMKGIYAAAFVYATHEIVWFVGAAATYANPIYTGESFASGFLGIMGSIAFSFIPLTMTLIAIMVSYFLAWRVFPSRKEIAIVIWPFVWGLIAIATNLPSTLELGIETSYFTNPWINAAEIMSWVIPVAIAMLPNRWFVKREKLPATVSVATPAQTIGFALCLNTGNIDPI